MDRPTDHFLFDTNQNHFPFEIILGDGRWTNFIQILVERYQSQHELVKFTSTLSTKARLLDPDYQDLMFKEILSRTRVSEDDMFHKVFSSTLETSQIFKVRSREAETMNRLSLEMQ